MAACPPTCLRAIQVSFNGDDLLYLPKDGGNFDGWSLMYASGPSGEKLEFIQMPPGSPCAKNFAALGEAFKQASPPAV